MSRTPHDLATRVLKLLGLLDAQEEASAEDAADIIRTYEEKWSEFSARELVYWPRDVIPDEAFQHIARIVADDMATTFGRAAPVENDESGRQTTMGAKGMMGLRRLIERQATGLPTVADYF